MDLARTLWLCLDKAARMELECDECCLNKGAASLPDLYPLDQ